MLNPKPVTYCGWNMKSKLEGMYAVFVDKLGLDFIYEPERFKLSNGQIYTPDFWIPSSDLMLEIKPTWEIALAERERWLPYIIELGQLARLASQSHLSIDISAEDQWHRFVICTNEPGNTEWHSVNVIHPKDFDSEGEFTFEKVKSRVWSETLYTLSDGSFVMHRKEKLRGWFMEVYFDLTQRGVIEHEGPIIWKDDRGEEVHGAPSKVRLTTRTRIMNLINQAQHAARSYRFDGRDAA